MSKKVIIFIDCGDTLVDESTQIWNNGDDNDLLLSADLFEGAQEMMHTLFNEGYEIALVADGRVDSFANITRIYDLDKCFKAKAISQAVGCCKPNREMFDSAMQQMGLTYEEDVHRIIMVGNNIRRDIKGANALGITSVLIDLSPRYDMTPTCKEETPDYIIHTPMQLLDVVKEIETKLNK